MLTQRGTQKIVVIVRKDSGFGSQGAGTKDVDNNNANDVGGEAKTKRSTKIMSRSSAIHTTLAMKQVAFAYLDYSLSGIGLRSGDEALQDKVDRNLEIIQDTTSATASVLTGGLYGGASGGVVGALIGATVGAITSASTLLTKYAGRERTYNYKVFKENNAIQYNRAVYGINATAGRLR